MTLSEQLPLMPFIRILPPLAVGILTARFITAPDGVVWAVAGLFCLLAWVVRSPFFRQLYLFAVIWATGLVLSQLADTREAMPRGQRLLMVVEVRETPFTEGRWQRTSASVGWFRAAEGQAAWERCEEKIQLYVDTAYRVVPGEQLTIRGYLNPIDTTNSSYGRLMRARDLSARTYLTPGNLVARDPALRENLSTFTVRAQRWAVERLSRLPFDNETDRHMLLTLVAGERRGLDRGLRADYARTGVSHILSISGLHMGFVLFFINLLTGWIVLFRSGHLVRNGLVIAGLWGYALIAGLAPSVIRAALMMSLAQLAFGFSLQGNRYNLLLGAATLMLAVNPHYLYDISFQLSFLAVLAILFLYPRLYRLRLSRNRLVDSLWSTVLVGVAAQIGTIPLVAYAFGNLPLVALLINPVVIGCSFVAVSLGLCWLLLPIGLLGGLFAWLISAALWIQNTVVEWAAALPYAALDGIRLNGWSVAGVYALLIALACGWKLLEERRSLSESSRIMAL